MGSHKKNTHNITRKTFKKTNGKKFSRDRHAEFWPARTNPEGWLCPAVSVWRANPKLPFSARSPQNIQFWQLFHELRSLELILSDVDRIDTSIHKHLIIGSHKIVGHGACLSSRIFPSRANPRTSRTSNSATLMTSWFTWHGSAMSAKQM